MTSEPSASEVRVNVDVDIARRVRGFLELRELGLSDLTFRNHWSKPRLRPPGALMADGELTNVLWARSNTGLTAFYVFNISATVDPETKELPKRKKGKAAQSTKLFSMECGVRVEFSARKRRADVEPFDAVADEDLLHFLTTIPRAQVRTYVRVLVQDLTTKAGWPPLLLPLQDPPATFDRSQFIRLEVAGETA